MIVTALAILQYMLLSGSQSSNSLFTVFQSSKFHTKSAQKVVIPSCPKSSDSKYIITRKCRPYLKLIILLGVFLGVFFFFSFNILLICTRKKDVLQGNIFAVGRRMRQCQMMNKQLDHRIRQKQKQMDWGEEEECSQLFTSYLGNGIQDFF